MRISDWSSDVCSSDLIGQRQIARIEYAHLGAEQDEQAGRLLHRKPAERTRAQRTIEQQDTRRWIERTKARRQIMPDHRAIERRQDRKSTRLTPVTNAQPVCRLLLEKKKHAPRPLYNPPASHR